MNSQGIVNKAGAASWEDKQSKLYQRLVQMVRRRYSAKLCVDLRQQKA